MGSNFKKIIAFLVCALWFHKTFKINGFNKDKSIGRETENGLGRGFNCETPVKLRLNTWPIDFYLVRKLEIPEKNYADPLCNILMNLKVSRDPEI